MDTTGTKPTGWHPTRRQALLSGGALAASIALARQGNAQIQAQGDLQMTTLTTQDGTEIFFKDWGQGQPIVYSHGWPLTADAWDAQMLHFGMKGYRVVAHDRRGHGRSSQPWNGNDMDHYADDLAALIEELDLQNMILVGHSTGGGEIARYMSRHGTDRVAKVVMLGAVPPLMLQTGDNPDGTPMEVFDQLREGVATNRAQFYRDFPPAFFGFNRDGNETRQGLLDSFWLQGMSGSIRGQYECIAEFSEVDYTEDLRAIDRPTLVVHGGDDQIVPIEASARKTVEIVPNAELRVVEGASHGFPMVQPQAFNDILMQFAQS